MNEGSISSSGFSTVKSVIEQKLNPERLQNNFDEQPIIEDDEIDDSNSLFEDNQEAQQADG